MENGMTRSSEDSFPPTTTSGLPSAWHPGLPEGHVASRSGSIYVNHMEGRTNCVWVPSLPPKLPKDALVDITN